MQELSALTGVLAARTVGVISPGPSFVMVARTAVSASRSNGLAAALGMGSGGVLFVLAALLGLQAVLLAIPSLYLALKVAGGIYLAYLGFRIWNSARQLLSERPRRAYLRYKAGVDRVAGGVMMLLGLKLVLSGQQS